MANSNEFTLTEGHAIAIGAVIGFIGWALGKEFGNIQDFSDLVSIALIAAALLLIIVSERAQSVTDKEPWYFGAGLAAGVTAAELFFGQN